MKLAEALQERADLNRRIAQLRSRLLSNAQVQEGETPSEDPQELLTELDSCIMRLSSLMTRINLCNSQTVMDGQTLTALIAKKDCLRLQLEAYRALAAEASDLAPRDSRTEIKLYSTVDVKALQKQADAMAAELRQLDNQLQATNWTVDL